MSKIAVIGICGNSVFMKVNRFHRQGETLISNDMHTEMGGKGINQAIAAARMGADVSLLVAVGEDSVADECAELLRKENIHALLKKKKNKKTTCAYILTAQDGENRVTVYHDAELNAQDVLDFEVSIAESDFLLLQNEVPIEVNKTALKIAARHNVKVILNPAPARDIDDEDLMLVWMFTPNQQEAQALAEKNIRNCITTLGSQGCSINSEMNIPACRVEAVDTTGAGDTFNGVLAVCLAEGMSITKAAEYAIIASGISVTRPYVLNAIPNKNEIEREIKK